MIMKILPSPITFQWDSGNTNKNFHKHQVTNQECEEIFFDTHKLISQDVLHSGQEDRYLLIGHTKFGRALFIVFTIRTEHVRIISARDLNKKEQSLLL